MWLAAFCYLSMLLTGLCCSSYGFVMLYQSRFPQDLLQPRIPQNICTCFAFGSHSSGILDIMIMLQMGHQSNSNVISRALNCCAHVSEIVFYHPVSMSVLTLQAAGVEVAVALQTLSPDWHADCQRIVTLHNLSGLQMNQPDGVTLDWTLGLTPTQGQRFRVISTHY